MEDTRRIQNFFLEEPDSLDVVVMGASDVYAGYSPVLAYEEYGFTSYSYCMSGNFIQLLPSQIQDVLAVQSPQLLIVDISEIASDKGTDYDTIFRQYIAGIPFSWNKIQQIYEFGDRSQTLSYFFPFFTNHGNMDYASIQDSAKTRRLTHARGHSILKGSVTFTGSGENWDGEYIVPFRNTSGDYSISEISSDVSVDIHQFLTFCKENVSTKILFVNFPRRIDDEARYTHYQSMNTIGTIIQSYGYDFVNLAACLDDMGFQLETDFYNNDHLNLYGQYKLTRFLCDILKSEYALEGRPLSHLSQERWDTCVEYQHLYYTLFDTKFKERAPGEFGLWLKEDVWLYEKLEGMKK